MNYCWKQDKIECLQQISLLVPPHPKYNLTARHAITGIQSQAFNACGMFLPQEEFCVNSIKS